MPIAAARPATGPGNGTPFRLLAIAIGAVVALGAAVAVRAVWTHGDEVRIFGWTSARAGSGFVARVTPDGPAAGALRDGDRFVALNGDRRAERISPNSIRQFVRGPAYTVTVRRGEAEVTIPLTLTQARSREQFRLTASLVFGGVVWCLVATLIAVSRPDQPIARLAYAAGMTMGLFFLPESVPGAAMLSVSHAQQAIIWALFPIAPLHLAIGYDFYLRFPRGAASGRIWRGLRVLLYALCGPMAVLSFVEFVMFVAGEQAYLNWLVASAPVTRITSNGVLVTQAIAGLAIFGVLARNYRTVEGADDRRRLQWVVWGTIGGLTPFLIISVVRLAAIVWPSLARTIQPWNAPANIATVAIPLSFAYAIVKHQVFDITVVIRRGLQYLLAKNALRALLLLPAAGLAYGLVVQQQPIGRLLQTNSVYVYLIAAAVVSLKFRTQLSRWLDRRFFREAYDRERILLSLIEDVEKLESASSVSKLVSHELEAAFHPACLFVWYREADKPNLSLSYSSGGYLHTVELGLASPLVQLAERGSGAIALPLSRPDDLPMADRAWLDEAGVRLIVPMIGSDRRLLGMLMLGDKKSEEPYSPDDLKLLQAIARQIGVARETVRLKDRVEVDRRIRHDVLAHLETGHVSLLMECPSCGACYDAPTNVCAADGVELQLSLPVERTIDRKYRLDRLIGKGGMGAVYEAADLRLARRVAVKIMLGRAFGDRQALRRFEREAQASARLTHPNIVTVFDFGAVGAEGAFIVMELVRGRTLRAELERHGRLEPQTIAEWFGQICSAVAAAHAQGIVHRDLKPDNVLVTAPTAGGGVVKVLDFGLAKLTALEDHEPAGLTQPGVVIGTAGYMAPEQLTAGHIDERSDIFALGVMVAEAVTGRRPFRGRTHSELLMAILNEPFSLSPAGSEWRRLEAVLQRATAKDPSARYPSVGELSAELLPALRGLPAIAPPACTRSRDDGRVAHPARSLLAGRSRTHPRRRDGLQAFGQERPIGRREVPQDSRSDRLQEAAVPGERGAIVGGERGLHLAARDRRHELHAADEHARHIRRRGGDPQRHDLVDGLARNDVEEPRSFLEPGVAPGVDHRFGFLWIETVRDQDPDQLTLRRRRRVFQRRPVERGARAGDVVDVERDRPLAVLEHDHVADRRARGPHRGLAVGLDGSGDRRRELSDAAIEEELLGLRSRLERGRVGVARLVVVARAVLGRKGRGQLRRYRDVTPGDRPSGFRSPWPFEPTTARGYHSVIVPCLKPTLTSTLTWLGA